MMRSRSETASTFAADIACGLLICAALPIGVAALIIIRLAEAASDSKAGKAVYRFWYGRRGS